MWMKARFNYTGEYDDMCGGSPLWDFEDFRKGDPGVISCRGDFTGEEILLTLVLPSVDFLMLFQLDINRIVNSCRGDSQGRSWFSTLVLPSLNRICFFLFLFFFFSQLSGRFTGYFFHQFSFSLLCFSALLNFVISPWAPWASLVS